MTPVTKKKVNKLAETSGDEDAGRILRNELNVRTIETKTGESLLRKKVTNIK